MMRVTKPKRFLPWYKLSKNQPIGTKVFGDIDRKGNAYQLTVHESLNKDGELVQDVIRVEHFGNLWDEDKRAIALMVLVSAHDIWWPRCIESGDIRQCMIYLEHRMAIGPVGHLVHRLYNDLKERCNA
uniref:Uncharacterized protein n=1 Tax=Pseudomonas phage RVTF4 TaxID=3236931 RepID=A0AB39CCP6_9VIRU